MESNDTLATDLLKTLKAQSRRWFVAFLIVLSLLITTNLIWLYVEFKEVGPQPCASIEETITSQIVCCDLMKIYPHVKRKYNGSGLNRRKRKYDYFRFHEARVGLF